MIYYDIDFLKIYSKRLYEPIEFSFFFFCFMTHYFDGIFSLHIQLMNFTIFDLKKDFNNKYHFREHLEGQQNLQK